MLSNEHAPLLDLRLGVAHRLPRGLRRDLVALLIAGHVIKMSSVTCVIPFALDVSLAVGGHAAFSGLLISLPFALSGAGALISLFAFSQPLALQPERAFPRAKRGATLAAIGAAASMALYAFAASSAARRLSPAARIAVLCASRASLGVCGGVFVSTNRMLVNAVVAEEQQVRWLRPHMVHCHAVHLSPRRTADSLLRD